MADRKPSARKRGSKRGRVDDTDDQPTRKKQVTSRPEQTAYDESISKMGSSLLSDHLAKKLKQYSHDSTAIELEDRYIPVRAIRDTTIFTKHRVATNLPVFLQTFLEPKEDLSRGGMGMPHTIIITSSGIRAADLTRELRSFSTGDVKVAKLFAKHMKMAESIAFVQKTKINIVVGTPHRPKALIDQGALELGSLKRIVIDGSYIDEKERTIFDMRDVFLPLIDLLNVETIKQRFGADGNAIEVIVF